MDLSPLEIDHREKLHKWLESIIDQAEEYYEGDNDMTETEKMLYEKWISKIDNESLEKEYEKVKKMKKTDASLFMKSICEKENNNRDKIIGL